MAQGSRGFGRRPPRLVLLAAAPVVVLGLAAAWYLASPLFIRSTLIEPPAPTAQGEQALARGSFDVKDSVHRGSGTATLVRSADGQLQVRLEDFSVTNGPDLYVYLSGSPSVSSSRELHVDEVSLGRLKAPEGTFAYSLDDPSVDVSKVKSVVIYCRAFSVVFSSAELTPLDQRAS